MDLAGAALSGLRASDTVSRSEDETGAVVSIVRDGEQVGRVHFMRDGDGGWLLDGALLCAGLAMVDPSPAPSPAAYEPVGSPEPAGAALVLHQDWPDTGPQLDTTAVLADGRVIHMVSQPDQPIVLEERVLSARGLELVLAEVTANPLFVRSQSRQFIATPPACCGAGDAIVLVRDGREVRVGRMLMPADVYAPSAAWDDFERLLGWLDALETSLPADAWLRREARPFAASAYRVSIGPAATGESPLEPIDWPAGFDPTSFGIERADDPTSRCGILTAAATLAIARQADALRAAQGSATHPTLGEGAHFDAILVRGPDGRVLTLAFRALLPHEVTAGATVCSDSF